MKIAYLIESTGLSGGVKVVCRQAQALLKRGHNVVIFSPEVYPGWIDYQVPFCQNSFDDLHFLESFDRIIVTAPLLALSLYSHERFRSRIWHLCQGYEGDYSEGLPYIDTIESAYALSIPKLVISERLARCLQTKFGGQFHNIGQGIEHDLFYPVGCQGDSEKSIIRRIFLVGPLTISVKRIAFALEAMKQVYACKPDVTLVRISSIDTRKEEEGILGAKINEYHCHLAPKEVGQIFRGGGILLSSSSDGEGFGLPVLEAMACGNPTVITSISSYRNFAQPVDYASFVHPEDLDGMARRLCQLIDDPGEQERLEKRGVEVASFYHFDRVAEQIETVFTSA